jgi:hypothetical protein
VLQQFAERHQPMGFSLRTSIPECIETASGPKTIVVKSIELSIK